ncbi:Glycine/D-amino acid oxidase [Natronoarchaeum philippinense]|uniref:Glycine/D-amino acid oxidase n=1 Tax=Natronoarchaeum philippinense TaxID=558529 RepID=A0A285P6L1_NATPI|nr:FAD-binding oxidoreductase [Natronoarchaeum philippinense]SNZ17372.1 Glycine/D-amino acid oxidase [Natronoarchaeum philippinense]
MQFDLPASPATPPPELDRSVAVIGAGAVGATAARDLARWGADVTLFERDAVGAGATGRAAGIVYDAFAEDLDAAVADRAIERFRTASGSGEFALTEQPYVWFAREGDDRRAEAIREQASRMRANGRSVEVLEPAAVADRWPALRTDDLAVVAVARTAGTADPEVYAAAMVESARADGAAVEVGSPASIETDPIGVRVGHSDRNRAREGGVRTFDAVLVAAGARTPTLLADAGVEIACAPYRVQALTVGVAEGNGDLPTFYDATGEYYARPNGTGLLAGDGVEPGAADPEDWTRDADAWFREELIGVLSERVDGVDTAATDSWAGLCTATPDRNPLVGSVAPGLVVATGFHGHGFMRAPAIGELAARELCGGDGVAAFDPTRFDGGEQIEIADGIVVDERG